MNNRVTRFVMVLVAVAIYWNVGWAIGTYYHNYIWGHTPQTFWQTVWNGGYQILSGEAGRSKPLLEFQIIFMFFWPVFVGFFVPISWVIRFAHIGILFFVWFISYIFELIFAGGIAKLLGVG